MKTLTYKGPFPNVSVPWKGKGFFAERGKPCEFPDELADVLKKQYPANWSGAAPKQARTEGES